jgi:hypothetical protein
MKLLLLAAALIACLPSALAGDDEVPQFAEFGKKFLKTRLKTEKVADVPAAKLHDQFCVHGAFGAFEIAYPTWAITEKGRPEDLRAITMALLQVQQRWIDWLAKGKPAAEIAKADAAKADAETLVAWVKTWKPAAFSKAESAADKDLYVLLGGTDAHKQAAKRLAEFINKPDALGVAPKTGDQTHLLFAPTRLDFVQLLAYTGMLDPTQQAQLWTSGAVKWTGFWLEWTLVLALEYPPWTEDKKFETGLSMNKFEPTGMLEHTLQQSMLAFLWMVYGDNDALYLNQAQAMNMVIEVVGEINALEGEGGRGTTGARTEAYEKFVPGGNPSGGTLPPISAAPFDTMKTNPWHEGMGKDHFLAPLRKGQKAAMPQLKKDNPHGLDPMVVKDKNAHFVISAADSRKHVITAPFFGKFSKEQPYPPGEFIADYKEFFRAYKCAFFWWMQTEGAGDASAAKYAELMRTLATREPDVAFDDVVAKIYGVPLSGKNLETDSLEWRFLDWLAKGK